MRRWGYFSKIVILGTLLVGCTSNPVIQATDTPTIQISETSTRKPSPTFKPTRTITPIWTPEPTETPMPENLAKLAEKYRCSLYDYKISPSEEWSFFYQCFYEYIYPATEYYEATSTILNGSLLYNRITEEYWFYPPCQFIEPGFSPGCNPQAIYKPLTWSPDGHYLYLGLTSGGDGGGLWSYFLGSMKLLRVNLGTGELSLFIDKSAYYSFSPDFQSVAYIPYVGEESGDSLAVYVRDLTVSSEFNFKLEHKYKYAGGIQWEPDGSGFYFVALTSAEMAASLSRLMQVNVHSQDLFLLVDDLPAIIIRLSWRSEGLLELHDELSEVTFFYNEVDRQMITPTP